SRENVSELMNGSKYVFFNKKSNQFLNLEEDDLSYEEYLINNSGNKEDLQDQIQKIKITASKIFTELNQNSSTGTISNLLKEFDSRYWKKILDFTQNYFDIEIPEISRLNLPKKSNSNQTPLEKLKDYSGEYNILVATNKNLGKEFIQLLHDYRSKKVNSSHLELEQLFNPMELYNYLRNHHWKEGIPDTFLKEWSEMKLSQYQFTESDFDDFETILSKLGLNPSASTMEKDNVEKPIKSRDYTIPSEIDIPSLKDFPEFKLWILNMLDNIEAFIDVTSKPQNINKSKSYSIITEQSETHTKLVVDLTNILYEDQDKNKKLRISNILSIRKTLLSKGYNPFFIVDASTKYGVDDKEQYEMLVKQNLIRQAPAGRAADKFVLRCAQKWNCKFLTNDQFTEYWDEFGKEWIFKNRITCMFIEGELILD
ncbi:MAG: NYN domain-containing protein, partial [Candidatus Hodarchaeales archaeon]